MAPYGNKKHLYPPDAPYENDQMIESVPVLYILFYSMSEQTKEQLLSQKSTGTEEKKQCAFDVWPYVNGKCVFDVSP